LRIILPLCTLAKIFSGKLAEAKPAVLILAVLFAIKFALPE
jgi:hypothetical protein